MTTRRGTLANITNLVESAGPARRVKRSDAEECMNPRASVARASLAPRPSLHTPRPSLHTPRPSLQTPRPSLLPASGRPSLNQSIRGRTNTSTVGNAKKDPRDWRDKGFVVICQKRLMKYLVEWGYPHGIGPRTLSSPSNKEFLQMFQFLYLRIDPSYKFSSKPEDEVLPLLASLHYPSKISKVRTNEKQWQMSLTLTLWSHNSRVRSSRPALRMCGPRSWA